MKKISKAEKVRAALRKNPEADLAKLARQLGMSYQTAWGVRDAMKKAEAKKDGLPRTPEGKIRMQAPKQLKWKHVTVAPKDEALEGAARLESVAIDKAHKEPTPTGTDAMLAERGSRYGKFTGHAKVTQVLKNVLSAHAKSVGNEFTWDQAEALDMICHKLGRIVNGDPNYPDSWRDIEGYSKLVADRLETGKEV